MTNGSAWAMAGIVSFVTAVFLGPAVTAFLPVRTESWWLWPIIRVVWVVGSALWCGAGLGRLMRASFDPRLALRWATVLALLAGLLSFNAISALRAGPIEAIDPVIRAGTNYESIDGRYDEIWIEIDGGEHTWSLEPIGLQKARAKAALGDCLSPFRGRITFLPGLDILLSVDCAR